MARVIAVLRGGGSLEMTHGIVAHVSLVTTIIALLCARTSNVAGGLTMMVGLDRFIT